MPRENDVQRAFRKADEYRAVANYHLMNKNHARYELATSYSSTWRNFAHALAALRPGHPPAGLGA